MTLHLRRLGSAEAPAGLEGIAVSRFEASCHAGTHLDAPYHLDPGGHDVCSVPLDRLIGIAEVVHVPISGARVGCRALDGWHPRARRVLVRTDCLPLGAPIDGRIAGLEVELVHRLADEGVELVGIDSPSVDLIDDTALSAHRALLMRSMTWLEGLWLEHVPAGLFELVALPLALKGADAAPIRAAVRAVPDRPEEPQSGA